MRRHIALTAVTSLLVLSACQKSGIEKAREQSQPLVDAACGWMFSCCSPGELTYQVGGFTVSADNCSERMLDAISTGEPLDLVTDLSDDSALGLLVLALSINEDSVKVNEDAVAACAAATSSMACNFPTMADPDERCTPGALVPADPCDPEDLFDGLREAGEACNGTWDCTTGLRCVDFGLGGVCAAKSPVGGFCFADAECEDRLVCDWLSGTCTVGAQLGQFCAFSNPDSPLPGTETIRCGENLSCDPVSLTCVGGYCAPGADCNDTFTDLDCPEGTFCVGNMTTAPTCQAPGGTDAPCTKPADCQSNACDLANGQCIDLLPDGDFCNGNTECNSGYCDVFNTQTCVATVPVGSPCLSGSSDECNDGYCDLTDALNPVCAAYVGAGGDCVNGNECDPGQDLSCVDMSCLEEPFPNGTSCFGGMQCDSGVCYLGVCESGTAVGGDCMTDGSTEPCVLGAFCEAPAGMDAGSCALLRRSGEVCENSEQCWGTCEVRYGIQMCDSTAAFALDELWCDGQ